MRHAPNTRTQPYRQPDPVTGIVYANDNEGMYLIPCDGVTLAVIVSEGGGWDHVSVSLPKRCPTWDEMDYVRRLFFRDDETVMQLHVPMTGHVNMHRFCLHLWRPQQDTIPRPPSTFV